MPRQTDIGRRWRIADFIAGEQFGGLAASSVAKYASTVRRWCDYIGDPFGPAVTYRDVERWIASTGMRAATSRANAVTHLHAFYLWAMRDELIDRDPTALVRRPRIPPAQPRPMTDTDLALALALADRPMTAALMLGAYCGLRCVELTRARWDDVDGSGMRIRGKGGRDRPVWLPAVVRDALDDLDRVDVWVLPWREDPGIAPGRRASHAIRRYLRSVGVEASAHQLRHWCGTRALEATNDLAAVQDYLGHASPATTRVYARLSPTRLRAVAEAMPAPVPAAVGVPA